MTQKMIGPTFPAELAAYGVANSIVILGTHFTWFGDGTLEFFSDTPFGVQPAVEAVYAAHDPSTQTPQTIYGQKITAGIAITSTATPGLSATYALDDTTISQISSVARDAASGLGLPQGLSTFTYPDINGDVTGHNFASADVQHLYKAMRDLVAGLQEQLAVALQGGTPTWPSQTATIA